MDISHIDRNFSDYVRGKTHTISDQDDETYDYQIDGEEASNEPIPRLDLDKFEIYLQEEAQSLNSQFLAKVDQQFAEYLSLTVNQIIFDRNLASKEFLNIFRTEDEYSESLDEKAAIVSKIVDQQEIDFATDHIDQQTKLVNKLVKDYVATLRKLAKSNEGFPDTEAMRVALFGQVAFKYEQKCQRIYSKISDKWIGDTIRKVTAKLNEIEGIPTFLNSKAEKKAAKDALKKNTETLFLY